MAVAQNTVIIDDVEYKPGEQLPQLGSIHRVFKDGGKRHYEGLAKDSDKLPLYVANNSSCFMTDTGEYYKFDESKKLWYKPDKIEQSKVTPIEVYGVLNGKIKQVSEDVEGIATPLLYKGSVSDISQLPLSPKIGWMYNISEKSIYGEAGMNVAWTGEIWDTLGPAIDMAPYLREDSEIVTSLKTKTENLESANYTDRGTLADTDAFMVNDGTGMKKSVLSKLSDFVLNKIADKVFAKLQTNDKTILGAINELNSNVGIIRSLPRKTSNDFNQGDDTSSETFYKNLLHYMKENGFRNDGTFYVSIQVPNGRDLVLGYYNPNDYAGFISIPYGENRIDLFGLTNGNYYFNSIKPNSTIRQDM